MDMVCLRNISLEPLHRRHIDGDDDDNDDVDNNNNNNKFCATLDKR